MVVIVRDAAGHGRTVPRFGDAIRYGALFGSSNSRQNNESLKRASLEAINKRLQVGGLLRREEMRLMIFWIRCMSCGHKYQHKIDTPIRCPKCDSPRFEIIEARIDQPVT